MPRLLLPGLVLLATAARAGEIQALEVSRQEQRYTVDLRATLNVPARAAYAAFADPDNLPQIDPVVRRMQVLGHSSDGGVRLYAEVRVCIAWYCRTLHLVQDMHYTPRPDGGDLRAAILPQAGGDFRSGRADWQFRSAADGTRLHFQAELEPAFWIPPVLGPWLVARSLRGEAEATSAGIERLARAPAP